MDDLREAIADQRIRAMKGLGQKAEENIAAQLEKLGTDGPCRTRSPLGRPSHRREAGRRPARTSRVRGGRRRRVRPAPGRDVQGRRPDRHRKGSEGAGDRARRAPAGRGVGQPRAGRGEDHHAERRLDRPADRRARGLREPPPALHRLGRPTTSSSGSARVKMGLSVSEHGITDVESGKVEQFATEEEVYERLGLYYIEPELRESAGRDQGRARRQAAEARDAGRHQGRPPLAHDALGRQERARGDGRGGALSRLCVLRGHRPLRVPRLRRPRDARDARGADRGDRRAERARSRRSASACSRGPR